MPQDVPQEFLPNIKMKFIVIYSMVQINLRGGGGVMNNYSNLPLPNTLIYSMLKTNSNNWEHPKASSGLSAPY